MTLQNLSDFQKAQKQWIEENPIRKRRKKMGLSLSQFASMLGVGYLTLQYWETGKFSPKDDGIAKLNEHIGGDVEEELEKWWDNMPSYEDFK